MVYRAGPVVVLLLSTLLMPVAAAAGSTSDVEPLPLDRVQIDKLASSKNAAGEVRFAGGILVADPSRTAFGPEPLLWSESCHHWDVTIRGAKEGRLYLENGASGGELEDLDVYVYGVTGSLVISDNSESRGIGLHHAVALDGAAKDIYICLASGARADYEFLIS